MPLPTLDFETASEAGFIWNEPNEAKPLGRWTAPPGAREKGLSAVGTVAYAQHPTTRVLTASYDLCDGRGVRRWRPGQPLPYDLFDHIARDGAILGSHKAMFERMIWTHVCCRLYGWPALPPHVQRCSMATAYVNQYPGKLAKLGEVLRLPIQKDKEGERLIKKFSIPRDPTKKDPRRWIMPEDDPEDFERFCAYCDTDVLSEQSAADNMEPMTPAELEFWLVDQEINSRGIAMDREGVRACIRILNQVQERYGEECRQITGGIGPTQVEALRGWLAAQGIYLDSMDADAIEEALGREGLPAQCRRVLETRALTGSASVKKLFSMENQCCADNRLRDLIVHHGARTGRPTGEGPQPLNLPRTGPKLVVCPCGKPYATVSNDSCPWCGAGPGDHWNKAQWTPEMIEPVLEIMSLGSLDMVERFFGDALLCISGCLRGLFVAGDDHDLIASDYSAIEAVVAACLAGEQWRIEAFQKDLPIYLVGASKITGTPLQTYLDYKASHGEHHPDRQTIGKVSELACVGPLTQVLTKRGYVSIVGIRIDDQLWDGEQWVEHEGVIFKGHRIVCQLDGVQITPDHLVNMNDSWLPASILALDGSILCRALASGSKNLPSSGTSLADESIKLCSVAIADQWTLKPDGVAYGADLSFRAPNVQKNGNRGTQSSIGATRILCVVRRIVDDCSIGLQHVLRAVALKARTKSGTLTIAAAESEFTNLGHGVPKVDALSSRISSRWKDGTFQSSNWIDATPTDIMNPETSDLSPKKRTSKRAAPSATCKRSLPCTSRVYDIVNAGPRNRFTIKTDSGHLIVHNCGFGGWIGSYKAFGSTEDDATIKAQILAWRAASPAIVEMWGGQWRGLPWDPNRYRELYGVEGMAICAIQSPGRWFWYGGIGFIMWEGALRIRLLSGRDLIYRNARVVSSQRRPDELTILYDTWNSNPKYGPIGWGPMETYGGRLFENIVQAVSHCILRYAILALRAAGYPTVLHVYDEVVAEMPHGVGSLEEFERIMATLPPWARLPDGTPWPIIVSGGWRHRRYRKG